MTKIYWVATYGDHGLDVTHYTSKKKYLRALAEARRDHKRGANDSYTNGEELF